MLPLVFFFWPFPPSIGSQRILAYIFLLPPCVVVGPLLSTPLLNLWYTTSTFPLSQASLSVSPKLYFASQEFLSSYHAFSESPTPPPPPLLSNQYSSQAGTWRLPTFFPPLSFPLFLSNQPVDAPFSMLSLWAADFYFSSAFGWTPSHHPWLLPDSSRVAANVLPSSLFGEFNKMIWPPFSQILY